MANQLFNPMSPELLEAMCSKIERKSQINPDDFWKYGVKRGLRNHDGTGVMAGLTKICAVEGYYVDDGERVPKKGKLKYRGINIEEIMDACEKENRFGFEEVAYPEYLFSIGIIGFIFLMWIGTIYFNKGIKEQ